jgi:branched-chain amino acid aminotransferase
MIGLNGDIPFSGEETPQGAITGTARSRAVSGLLMTQIEIHSEVQFPKEPLDPTRIEFGTTFTPNMFTMRHVNGKWQDARVAALHNFSLHPASIVFHYSQEIFEGLKAFQQVNGDIALFRPEMNARRFNRSAERLNMPFVDEDFFVEAIRTLVEQERHFVPPAPGSLYIRPTMIGVEASIGVRSANEFIFFILCLPSGSYFREAAAGAGAVRVMVSESVGRACKGGTGAVKTGGNYAATLNIITEAKKKGCAQVLFLNAADRKNIEEMGGMNVCFVRKGDLLTPPLTDTILAGVVRDTVLQLAGDVGLAARETSIEIAEVVQGIESGEITEAFACGTAASITGIECLQFEDGRVVTPKEKAPGPISNRLHRLIHSIQYGETPDTRGWLRKVCSVEAAVRA